jgi:uncharacterized membrane protein YbhN (UPF0104 family)
MLASDHAIAELQLPGFDARALLRRALPAALLTGVAVAVVLLAGRHLHGFLEAARRGLEVRPAWAGVGAAFEFLSLAGYVALLALVAGRATPRIGRGESAQITLAGAAATRLLPTAGAGGVALALWTLRRAGLSSRAAVRAQLVFLVLLYSVFLVALVLAGGALAFGLAHASGPTELAAVPALGALAAIALALTVAIRGPAGLGGSRLRSGARMLSEALGDAWRLVRRRDRRLLGAIAYWAFDAAVLWAMLHAFGVAPSLPVVALAYLVGQLANTAPIPGSVSGGMTGVLVALGAPAESALAAVLAYRAIATWAPFPIEIAAVPRLRATVARWAREDARVVRSPLARTQPAGSR